MTWIFWLVFGLYAAGAVFWTATALAYGLRSAWWHRAEGRALLLGWGSLAAVLDLAAIFRIIRLPLAVIVVLAVIVLSAVDLAGLWQFATVLRLQRRDRS